jgi:hypothetical protein
MVLEMFVSVFVVMSHELLEPVEHKIKMDLV